MKARQDRHGIHTTITNDGWLFRCICVEANGVKHELEVEVTEEELLNEKELLQEVLTDALIDHADRPSARLRLADYTLKGV